MAKKKERKIKVVEKFEEVLPVGIPAPEYIPPMEKKVIQPISIDYTSEGLNDMARKINEIIEAING